MDSPLFGSLPGIGTLRSTTEAQVWVGNKESQEFATITLLSSAVDSSGSNSPTTTLLPGLVLGIVTATGKFREYAPANTDGSNVAAAVLTIGQNMLEDGSAIDKEGYIIAKGILRGSALRGLDNMARKQLVNSGRFIIEDDPFGKSAFGGGMLNEVPKTSAYTLVVGDNGTLFTTTGAVGTVAFTLPALTPGFRCEFLDVVDQQMSVTSPEGTNIVWDGNAGVTSLTFSTASHKIGGHLQFECNAAGTKWYVRQLGPSGATVTAA